MMTKKILVPTIVAALCVTILPTAYGRSKAADWPNFRGPNRDGVSTEKGLLKTWPETGPKKLWQVSLGGGFSGLSAVDGRLYTLSSGDGKEYAVALDAETGKTLWKVAIDRERKDRFGDGPRSTPLVNGDLVYVVSASGALQALKTADGSKVWGHDLTAEFGAVVPQWGVSASPILDGKLLLYNVGGRSGKAVMAFDQRTGKVAWSAGSDIPGYSNPITIEVGGVRQTIFFSGTQIFAVAPQSGEILWQKPWQTSYDVNAAAPIFIAPDTLLVSSGYDVGATLYRLSSADGKVKVDEVWQSRGLKNQFSSSVYSNGILYGFDNKVLKAIDAKTGKDLWRKGGLGHGSLLLADGHLIVLGEGGQLLLVEATAKDYVEKASFEVAEGKHWTVPTLYNGRLYVRNERDLMCFQIT